jgi:hypothetical protein
LGLNWYKYEHKGIIKISIKNRTAQSRNEGSYDDLSSIFSALILIFTNRSMVDKDDEAIIEMLQTLYLRVVLEMFSKSDDIFASLQDIIRFEVKGQ